MKDSKDKQPWFSSSSILASLVVVRTISALFNHISDCDETFNYWEPTSFLLYNKGFQTWEYSPVYALRSYVYILFHAGIGKCLQSFGIELMFGRIGIFYGTRIALGVISAVCELKFIQNSAMKFGRPTAQLCWLFMLFGSGMFNAATAYLPTTFAMYCIMLSYAMWFEGRHGMAVFWMGVASLIGWPFAVIAGGVMGLDVLRREGLIKCVVWGLLTVTLCVGISVLVDFYYYKKIVWAILNIVVYNSNAGSDKGQNLYGVEPWHYFIKNLILNFNLVFLMALLAPILALFSNSVRRNFFLFCSSFYIWFALFSSLPHKEERFMFVVYPLLCLSAANCFSILQEFAKKIGILKFMFFLQKLMVFAFISVSVSRSCAIVRHYTAPLKIFGELSEFMSQNENFIDAQVCVGKEWYRFPSHYFLPENARLAYLQSDFSGQLPKLYETSGDATSLIPSDMNDRNKQEMSRYVQLEECDFIVDLDLVEQSEPHYLTLPGWRVVSRHLFLDANLSPNIYRAFYVPFVSDSKNVFADYYVVVKT